MSSFLEDPPWDEEYLRKKYYQNFEKTKESLKKHPGYKYHDFLEQLKVSKEIFEKCMSDLSQSIAEFREAYKKEENFFSRSKRGQFKKRERAIWKEMFSTISSIKSLEELSQRVRSKLKIEGYEEKVQRLFSSDPRHHFIKKLRDFLTHRSPIKARWEVHKSFVESNSTVKFTLSKDRLLEWSNWNTLAIEYIDQFDDGISVEQVFEPYAQKIREFQNWFANQIKSQGNPELGTYRSYWQFLNNIGKQNTWRVLLEQFKNAEINPYDYLDQYFFEEELQQIYDLPHRSPEQVDLMIELYDETNACTEEIRYKVYEIFEVDEKS